MTSLRLRFATVLAVFTFLLLYTTAAENATANVSPRTVIVFFGDSTTQYGGASTGWESLLRDAYVRSVDTINRGLSGYNTRLFLQHAMPGIQSELTSYYKPTVIVIWFGVNDATLVNGPNAKQHVPLDEYKQNLIKMIQGFRTAAPQAKILLLSPGYIDEAQRRAAMRHEGRRPQDPLDRTNEETAKYAAACNQVAMDRGVTFFDVYAYFSKRYPRGDQRAALLRDGLHFTTEGDHVFYELVKDKIESMVPRAMLRKHQFPDDIEILP